MRAWAHSITCCHAPSPCDCAHLVGTFIRGGRERRASRTRRGLRAAEHVGKERGWVRVGRAGRQLRLEQRREVGLWISALEKQRRVKLHYGAGGGSGQAREPPCASVAKAAHACAAGVRQRCGVEALEMAREPVEFALQHGPARRRRGMGSEDGGGGCLPCEAEHDKPLHFFCTKVPPAFQLA
jgi:hypothetical protein